MIFPINRLILSDDPETSLTFPVQLNLYQRQFVYILQNQYERLQKKLSTLPTEDIARYVYKLDCKYRPTTVINHLEFGYALITSIALPRGAGKTYITAAFIYQQIKQDPAFRAVIVVPKKIILQWRDCLRKFKIEFSTVVTKTHTPQLNNIILTSNYAAQYIETSTFNVCFVDEYQHYGDYDKLFNTSAVRVVLCTRPNIIYTDLNKNINAPIFVQNIYAIPDRISQINNIVQPAWHRYNPKQCYSTYSLTNAERLRSIEAAHLECPICFEPDDYIILSCCCNVVCKVCIELIDRCPFCMSTFSKETFLIKQMKFNHDAKILLVDCRDELARHLNKHWFSADVNPPTDTSKNIHRKLLDFKLSGNIFCMSSSRCIGYDFSFVTDVIFCNQLHPEIIHMLQRIGRIKQLHVHSFNI